MIGTRKERQSADQIPIVIQPRRHRKPLVFSDRDRHRRIVLGVIFLDEFPMRELFKCCHVILEDGALRRLHGKVDDIRDGTLHALPDLRRKRDALIAKHFEETVGRGNADAANIERRMSRMHPRCRIHKLRNGAGRLHASDRHRLIDAESFCVHLVHRHSFVAKFSEEFRIVHQCRVVPLPCDRDAEEALFFAMLLPLFGKILEIRERRLVCPEHCRKTHLLQKRRLCVLGANDHFSQIAELL